MRTASIFENLIKSNYEKRGLALEIPEADTLGMRKGLCDISEVDDPASKELKQVLDSIYQKVKLEAFLGGFGSSETKNPTKK